MCSCSGPRRSTSKSAAMSPAQCTRIRTPWPSCWRSEGMTVDVTVVRSEIESKDTPIPFLTYYRDDSSLPEGEYAELQAGVDGYVHRGYGADYAQGGAGGPWRRLG